MVAKKKESKKEGKASHRGLERSNDGLVVSAKMATTVIVAVTRQVRHAKYGKYIRRTKRYFAARGKHECAVGDQVRIVECRPLSRHTHWRVEKILTKATVV